MNTRRMTTPALVLAAGVLLVGATGACGEGGGGSGPVPDLTPEPTVRENAGPAELDPARRIKRLSAEQFHESLFIATGNRWSRYEQFASSLGRPDFAEITEEGLEASVTFDKLVQDAARETCALAVAADQSRPLPGTEKIMRHAQISDRDPAVLKRNLKYMLLRFHAVNVTDDDDPRLDPYFQLLTDPEVPTGTPGIDIVMQFRWVAVCVAMATHPDFLSY